jgi:very-short-patch-repair endonuclease
VNRRQLRGLGLSDDQIDRRLALGRLVTMHRGVYAVGHGALPDRGRVVAALLAVPHAVASHRTAAALFGLVPCMPAVIELTVHGRAPRSRRDLHVHETRTKPDTTTIQDIPVTAPSRTLQDLHDTPDAERATREALVRRLIRPEDLPTGDEPTRSRLERAFLRLIKSAGLPQPLVNHPIGPYLADFVWADERLVVETDGYAAHGDRAAFEADRARDARLNAAGYATLRFTWRQIRGEPVRTAALLAQVLAQAAAASPSASNISTYSSPVASATGR